MFYSAQKHVCLQRVFNKLEMFCKILETILLLVTMMLCTVRSAHQETAFGIVAATL